MKSKIFVGEEKEFRSSIKKAPNKASEAAELITYNGCKLEEEAQSSKPNNNKITKKDVVQQKTLTGIAKVYSARIAKSQISMT